jgi:hypothetical protein
MTNEPTLLSWDSVLSQWLGKGHIDFLAQVCPQGLTLTAAKIVSKASYYDIDLHNCKSLTQAGDKTSEHPDLPTREKMRQLASEAKARALGVNAAINQETF